MQPCANCGHQNRPGVVYCDNCGASLLGKTPLSTKSVGNVTEEEKADMGVDSSVLTDVKVQGVSAFSINDTLRLEIEGGPEPIIFKPKAETIFGRRDPATGAMPDIDLTPYAGYRMGVSRRHAAIRQGEEASLNLWDLGSSNGTYLNGQKLSAHRPYRLHDGDELRLGQMMIRFHFQPPGSEAVAKPEEAKLPETGKLGPPPPSAKPQPAGPLPSATTAKPTDPHIKLESGALTANIAPEDVNKALAEIRKQAAEAAPKDQAPAADKPAAPSGEQKPAAPAASAAPAADKPAAAPAKQPKAAQSDVPVAPAAAEAKPAAPPQPATAEAANSKPPITTQLPVDEKKPKAEKKPDDEKKSGDEKKPDDK